MIAPIAPIGAVKTIAQPEAPSGAAAPGFAAGLKDMILGASDAEHTVDDLAVQMATGGPVEVHELMVATTKAQLAVDVLTQVRNKAVEAYQQISQIPL